MNGENVADEEIVVATTRPETILGDSAVAVHPSDDRYTKFIGRTVLHPFRNEEIPVVADDFVDQQFGTGIIHRIFFNNRSFDSNYFRCGKNNTGS